MHYGANAFSVNDQPTIVSLNPSIPIGQRDGMSRDDFRKINMMYCQAYKDIRMESVFMDNYLCLNILNIIV